MTWWRERNVARCGVCGAWMWRPRGCTVPHEASPRLGGEGAGPATDGLVIATGPAHTVLMIRETLCMSQAALLEMERHGVVRDLGVQFRRGLAKQRDAAKTGAGVP